MNEIVEYAENTNTALTAFFKMNQKNDRIGNIARTLTYQDFPQKFTLKSDKCHPQSKLWSFHQRKGLTLGCMVYIRPTSGERFYLRTLLMVTKGPKSFDDLQTVDGVLCETFHDACQKLGLLENDTE